MPGFDALAPDQKAVLQLLLKQGKSYEDIAGLLRLDAASVRERALDALDALGADVPGVAEGLSSERQDELADHLLLQQTASERAGTRRFLEGSTAGRAWARGVSSELRPIGGDALPEVPADPADVAQAFDALEEREVARERQQHASRLGGVIVLVAVALMIVVVVVLLFSRNKDSSSASAGDSVSTPQVAAETGTTDAKLSCTLAQSPNGTGVTGAIGVQGAATITQQQVNLNPPKGSKAKAAGYAVFAQGGVAFQADSLPYNRYGYKLWLWNSRTEALPLGFAVRDPSSKKYAGEISALPKAAEACGQLVLTRESSLRASTPGPIALSGPIK